MKRQVSEKPVYDFSFIKNIASNDGYSFYDEFKEILEDFETGLSLDGASSIISLFEKGFRFYLSYENKTKEFFGSEKYKPDLSEMVLPSKQLNKECETYLKDKFDINYKLIGDLRNVVNNPKNKIFLNTLYLRKKEVLTQLFAFFVTLNKLVNAKEEAMPSNSYLVFYSSFESEDEKERKKKLELAEEAFVNGDYDIAARYHAILDNQKMVDNCLRLFSLKILFQNLKSDFISKRDFIFSLEKYTKKEFYIVKRHFEPFELIVEMNEEQERVNALVRDTKARLEENNAKSFINAYRIIMRDKDKFGYLLKKMPDLFKMFDEALLILLCSGNLTLTDVRNLCKLNYEDFTNRIIDYYLDNIIDIDDELLAYLKSVTKDEKVKDIIQHEQVKRWIAFALSLYEEKNYEYCLEKIIELSQYLDPYQKNEFTVMRIDCLYHMKQFKELSDLFKKDYFKAKITVYLDHLILNDDDIRREINNFRETNIEAYLIETYLINNVNEKILYSETVESDSFFETHRGSEHEYREFISNEYNSYNEIKKNTILKVKRNELLKTLLYAVPAVLLIGLTTLLLILEIGLPYKEKATRVFFIVVSVLLTVASLFIASYQIVKFFKNRSRSHGVESEFTKKNDEYLSLVHQNTYEYKIALFYGFTLLKEPEKKPYPEIDTKIYKEEKRPLITKIVVNALGVICLSSMLISHNSFIYKRLMSNVGYFTSNSFNEVNWSLNKLRKGYKDVLVVKQEYESISNDVGVAYMFTDRNNINTTQKDVDETKATSISYSQAAIDAYRNVQVFMYEDYDLTIKNRHNKFNWDFNPMLSEINLYYLISEKTLKEDGGSKYIVVTPTSYSSNIDDAQDVETKYSFKNGVLTLFSKSSSSWEKQWTLSNFVFTSSSKASILAESSSGYQIQLEIDY